MKHTTKTMVKWSSIGLSLIALAACNSKGSEQSLTKTVGSESTSQNVTLLAATYNGVKVEKAVLKKAISGGKKAYKTTCSACHQASGKGMTGIFPPLAKSDWVNELENAELIKIVLRGMKGEIKVKGKKFNGTMTPLDKMSDKEIANVLTYVKNTFGNKGGYVAPAEVKALRSEVGKPMLTPKDIKGADKLGK